MLELSKRLNGNGFSEAAFVIDAALYNPEKGMWTLKVHCQQEAKDEGDK